LKPSRLEITRTGEWFFYFVPEPDDETVLMFFDLMSMDAS